MASMNQYLTESFTKNLSITLGSKKRSFKNYKSLEKWINEEAAFYDKIGNPDNGSAILKNILSRDINQRINQWRNDSFTGDDLIDELKNLIENNYKSKGLIASNSKEGLWMLKQHKKNPSLTQGSYSYFQNKIKGVSNSSISSRDGIFSAYLFDTGIEPSFDLEKEQYKSFYEEMVIEKDEILNELIRIKEENAKLNEEMEQRNTDWETIFATQKNDVQFKFDEQYEQHQTKMEESENFYEKKLAVKKAVTYWSSKAQVHSRNSYIFGVTSGGLIIVSLIAIIKFGSYLISLDLRDTNGVGRKLLTESGALQLWVYGFFIISMTLIIWFIRLLVKVFLSNLHLLSDAKERETMIMTYLALEREEKTLKDTDRDLILPSIFRVSTNGIIKEDSAPNSPINIITKKASE